MIWACSAAVAVHLAIVLTLGQFEGTRGSGGVVAVQTVTVRYVSPAENMSTPRQGAEQAIPDTELAPDPAAQVASAAASTVGAEGSQPRQYFDIGDVDDPASPAPDWLLDARFLARNGVRSLKVDVLISDAGRPERCTVTSMIPARHALYSVIERQLCQTRLTPAVRRGVAVPSVRHVEILLSED